MKAKSSLSACPKGQSQCDLLGYHIWGGGGTPEDREQDWEMVGIKEAAVVRHGPGLASIHLACWARPGWAEERGPGLERLTQSQMN